MEHSETIRSLSIQGKNNEIKALLLSDQSRDVYRFVFDEREATAAQVAEKFDLSIQHASGMLAKMWRQMYLRRSEQAQESGGYEWVYYP